MLNIIKSKLKNTYKKKSLNSENVTIHNKDFVPVVRDWKNSIYLYNKNTLSLIPVASRLVMKLINGYFSSYNLKIESKIRKKKLRRRLRKLSTNKIFLGDGEFKHTNDKVNITLYVYNRQKLNLLITLKKRYLRLFNNKSFRNKLKLIKNVWLTILKKQQDKKRILTNVLPNYSSKVYSIQKLYYKDFLTKSLKSLKDYMYFKQLLYINKVKFENSYLQGLINLIRKIFKKNIEFNIINLKYFYFNSDIFTQPLVLRLRRKRKLSRFLKKLVTKANIKNIKLNKISKDLLSNIFEMNNSDNLNNVLNNLTDDNSKYLKKVVLNDIKYKRVSGVRLQGAGRLSKRYTASRSLHKFKYKGNLVNAYTSIKGYPSAVIRGNIRSNIQFTKLNSKTRIGSFGVKGWISGT